MSEELAQAAYPSFVGYKAFLRWHADYLRFAASPGAAAEFFLHGRVRAALGALP